MRLISIALVSVLLACGATGTTRPATMIRVKASTPSVSLLGGFEYTTSVRDRSMTDPGVEVVFRIRNTAASSAALETTGCVDIQLFRDADPTRPEFSLLAVVACGNSVVATPFQSGEIIEFTRPLADAVIAGRVQTGEYQIGTTLPKLRSAQPPVTMIGRVTLQ